MTTLYTPANIKNCKDEKDVLIRLLIQGPPGSFKTRSCLTFPNPIFIDFDKGLTSMAGCDVLNFPFWNDEFVASLKLGSIPDALYEWIKTEGRKFSKEQTLIIDGLTILHDMVSDQSWTRTPSSKSGEKDSFAYWDIYETYFVKLFNQMLKLPCHVVCTSHEVEVRDNETGSLKRIKPILQTKRLGSVAGFFTDCFRAVVMKEDKDGLKKGEFSWQIKKDFVVDCKCRGFTDKTFIAPDYKELIKIYDNTRTK